MIDTFIKQLQASARADLSVSQMLTLITLHLEGTKLPTDLARVSGCSTSGMTGILTKLVTRGLAERGVVPGDRRKLPHSITSQGAALVESITNGGHDEIR